MTPLLRKQLNPNQNYSYHSPLLHQLKCDCEVRDQIESFDFESCLRPIEQIEVRGIYFRQRLMREWAVVTKEKVGDFIFNPNATVNLAIRLKDSILNALDYLLNSDDALGFFKAFHVLLAFLVAFLTAFIGLHFQVLGISPLDTHFATILILIMTTIVYSIAHVEIKLPQNAEYLPIFKLICLVSGIVALELLVAIIICPFWLLMVNICPILIVLRLLVFTSKFWASHRLIHILPPS
ncbi:hypothetical protein CFP56_018700 [Quercus suber]|uniref:Uncharacterized protein n=1 Tax=Quercus suber TaxID=58331 RepID=A0AAW0KL44_QUESU